LMQNSRLVFVKVLRKGEELRKVGHNRRPEGGESARRARKGINKPDAEDPFVLVLVRLWAGPEPQILLSWPDLELPPFGDVKSENQSLIKLNSESAQRCGGDNNAALGLEPGARCEPDSSKRIPKKQKRRQGSEGGLEVLGAGAAFA